VIIITSGEIMMEIWRQILLFDPKNDSKILLKKLLKKLPLNYLFLLFVFLSKTTSVRATNLQEESSSSFEEKNSLEPS